MVAIIVLSVAVWLSIPLVLSRVMGRRGFDGLSYLIVGVLFGPVAVIFAVMDVLLDAPEPPRILEKGRTGSGDVSVLVVIGGESTSSPSTAALTNFGTSLRRVGLVRVLPKGGRSSRRTARGTGSAPGGDAFRGSRTRPGVRATRRGHRAARRVHAHDRVEAPAPVPAWNPALFLSRSRLNPAAPTRLTSGPPAARKSLCSPL